MVCNILIRCIKNLMNLIRHSVGTKSTRATRESEKSPETRRALPKSQRNSGEPGQRSALVRAPSSSSLNDRVASLERYDACMRDMTAYDVRAHASRLDGLGDEATAGCAVTSRPARGHRVWERAAGASESQPESGAAGGGEGGRKGGGYKRISREENPRSARGRGG